MPGDAIGQSDAADAATEPSTELPRARAAELTQTVLLYTGFLLTGAYATLLGTALPLLAREWGLSDERSGALFLAQFLGSMTGALLRGLDLLTMIAVGFTLVAGSGALIALVSPSAAPLALFTYGLGLGTAMTSTSVLVSTSKGGRSGSSLASLNAFWAAGAGLAPWLLVPYVQGEMLHWFLRYFAMPAALMAVLLLLCRVLRPRPAVFSSLPDRPALAMPAYASRSTLGKKALLLGLLSFGSVGAETGIGGWMTTYVHRASGGSLASLGAASGFWLGLLGGRLVASVLLLGRTTPFALLASSLLLAVLASLLLLGAGGAYALVPLAVVSGASIGPLYPLVLSFALRSFRGRWPFMLAGLGAATTPWVVGLISGSGAGHADPLRAGLSFPLALLVSMAAALLASRRLLPNG